MVRCHRKHCWGFIICLLCAINDGTVGGRGGTRALSFKHEFISKGNMASFAQNIRLEVTSGLEVPGLRRNWNKSFFFSKWRCSGSHARLRPAHPRQGSQYLLPLPCVLPSRCSKTASTSSTHRRRAPGEREKDGQPPLFDGFCLTSEASPAVGSPPAASCGTFSAALSFKAAPDQSGRRTVRGRERPANQRRGGGARIKKKIGSVRNSVGGQCQN